MKHSKASGRGLIFKERPSKYPCLIIGLSVLCGISLEYFFGVPVWLALLGSATSAGVILKWKNPGLGKDIFLIVFLIGSGVFYLQARELRPEEHITRCFELIKGGSVSVAGTILDEPKASHSGPRLQRFVLALEAISNETVCRRVSGKVLVRLYAPLALHQGDRIFINGKIHEPFEFGSNSRTSYRRYLKRKGMEYAMSAGRKNEVRVLSRSQGAYTQFTRARRRLLGIFDRYLGAEESHFMGAVILGERSRLSKEIQAVFERTGTAHVLAISGLHISLVTGIFFVLSGFFPVGLKVRSALTCCLIIFYAVLIGNRPSVVRAVVMASLMLSSFVLERKSNGLNALGAAGLILMLIDPLSIFDIGFQLSFSAVTAILLFFPLIEGREGGGRLFERHSLLESFWHSWAVSVSAWLGVSGMIVYYFEYVSVSAIFANIVVVPLIGLIIAAGIFLLLAGFFNSPLAWAVAASLQAALRLMVWLVSGISRVPYLFFEMSGVSMWLIAGYYSALLLIWFVCRKLRMVK